MKLNLCQAVFFLDFLTKKNHNINSTRGRRLCRLDNYKGLKGQTPKSGL